MCLRRRKESKKRHCQDADMSERNPEGWSYVSMLGGPQNYGRGSYQSLGEEREKRLWSRSSLGMTESTGLLCSDGALSMGDISDFGQRGVMIDHDYQPFSLPVALEASNVGRKDAILLQGKLWHRRERIFSTWKERFFILSSTHLHCYKKCPVSLGTSGLLLFQVKEH